MNSALQNPAFEDNSASAKRGTQLNRNGAPSIGVRISARFRPSAFGLRVSISLAAIAAGLLLLSLRLPLWHMRMEAPQYRGPEALRVVVRPGSLSGNLNEIKILNQYIGVTIPDALPQTHWLPLTLCLAAGLGLVGVLLPVAWRRHVLLTLAALLALAMVTAAAQAQWQMYRIGHERNHHAALQGVGDFTPPLLGTRKLAQFELTSGLGLGSGCIAGALAIYVILGLAAQKSALRCDPSRPALGAASTSANKLQGIV